MTRVTGTEPIEGLDHLVVAVPDLAVAADRWRELGFTVSPKGFHSDELGTANHTIMLGRDYVELFGVVRPTPANAGTRRSLSEGGGVEAFAMAATDPDRVADVMRAQGHVPMGPGVYDREVETGDGRRGLARFGIVRWPAEVKVAGIGLFVCHHVTPEWVWLPELTEHANRAIGIATLYVAAKDPMHEALTFSRLTGGAPPASQDEGWVEVAGRNGRASLFFGHPGALEAHFTAEMLLGTRPEGVVAVDVKTGDLQAARLCAGIDDGQGRLPAHRCGDLSIGFVA